MPPAIPFPVASGGLPKFSLGSSTSAPVAAATKPPGISFQFSKPGEVGTGAKAKAKVGASSLTPRIFSLICVDFLAQCRHFL